MPTDLTIHVIPVPVGWSVEQAWEAISRGDDLEHLDGEPSWAVISERRTLFVHWYGMDEVDAG